MATYAELMRQRDAAVKIVNQIEEEMAEMENELFSVGRDMFGIYQLRDGEDLHYHRFESLDRLEKSGLKVEKDNYRLGKTRQCMWTVLVSVQYLSFWKINRNKKIKSPLLTTIMWWKICRSQAHWK